MMIEIDARGLDCPAPVIQTKTVVDKGKSNSVKVIIDNAASQQNVKLFLESQGFQTMLEQDGSDYLVMGISASEPGEKPKLSTRLSTERQPNEKKIMVMCATDRIGFGDDKLGQKLMANFLSTLKEMGNDLWRLIFVNNGVKLSIEGSNVLDDLREFEDRGIKILVCGTCLNHFNLLEKKQVGETTNMLDIVTSMQLADKVINI